MPQCACCENEGKWVEISMCNLCDKCNQELAESFEIAMTIDREDEENVYPN